MPYVIYTILLLPVLFVWGRLIKYSSHALWFGYPLRYFFVDYPYWPSTILVTAVCVLAAFFNYRHFSKRTNTQLQGKQLARFISIAAFLYVMGTLFFMKYLSEAGLLRMMLPFVFVAIIVAILVNGWEETGSWDVQKFPQFNKIVLLLLILSVMLGVTYWQMHHVSGGMEVTPRQIYLVLLCAGILGSFLPHTLEIVSERSSDELKKKGWISLSVSACLLIGLFFLDLSMFDLEAISAYEAPAQRCYLFGKCHAAGSQQFGGWWMTIMWFVFFLTNVVHLFTVMVWSALAVRKVQGVVE